MTRSHVKAKIGDRSITIEGEGLLPPKNTFDFILYTNTIKHWDPPNEQEALSKEDTALIIETLKQDFAVRNLKVDFE